MKRFIFVRAIEAGTSYAFHFSFTLSHPPSTSRNSDHRRLTNSKMKMWCSMVLYSLFIACSGQLFSGGELSCKSAETSTGKNSIFMRNDHSEGEENMIKYSIYEVLEDTHEDPELEVEYKITECNGKYVIHVRTSLKNTIENSTISSEYVEPRKKELRFHKSGAKNVVVSPDMKTAKRINELDSEGYGGLLTNRPLNDDELLEVKITKTTIKYDDTIGIGVTYYNPVNIDYHDWMPCGAIILYDNKIFEHGVVSKRKYGGNLRTLRVGDRVGVMKKSNGNLHFFMNGEDQGVARSNVTYEVYGVVDIYGKVIEVSIVS